MLPRHLLYTALFYAYEISHNYALKIMINQWGV